MFTLHPRALIATALFLAALVLALQSNAWPLVAIAAAVLIEPLFWLGGFGWLRGARNRER